MALGGRAGPEVGAHVSARRRGLLMGDGGLVSRADRRAAAAGRPGRGPGPAHQPDPGQAYRARSVPGPVVTGLGHVSSDGGLTGHRSRELGHT